jgi:PBSX family phage terminase large subunit
MANYYREIREKSSHHQTDPWPEIGNLTNLKTGKNYRPNSPSVFNFHSIETRYKALSGGLGSGKTAAGSIEAIKRIKAGRDGAVISPDHQHFVKSAFEEFSKWCPWEHLVKQNKTEKWWLFDTGAKVFYGGIDDPESWRGPNLNWIWFDEAARKKTDAAWKILIARIRIPPNPCIFLTTTPKPHWLKRVFVTDPPTHEGQKLTAFFRTSTRDNVANLDPVYYSSLLAAYTGKYAAQELEGEFVTFEGLVYDDISLEDWPAGNLTDDKIDLTSDGNGKLKYPIEMAFDDGYVDPRAIYWIQPQLDRNRILIFDEIYHSRHLENVCVSEVVDRCKERGWPLPSIAIGSHEAITLREEFRKANIVARHDLHKIVEGIKNMRRFILDGNNKRILAINRKCCKNLILELSEKYCYPEASNDRSTEKPIDAHNHGADAIRMWLWARQRKGFR